MNDFREKEMLDSSTARPLFRHRSEVLMPLAFNNLLGVHYYYFFVFLSSNFSSYSVVSA